MDDFFFIRYSLQQSCAVLGSNQFDCEDILTLTREQREAYIAECDRWQQQKAKELAVRFTGRIDALCGKKVIFLGDSQTANRLGYRGIVVKAAGLTEYNAAFSGAVSTDMLRGVLGCVRSFRPDIAWIMIGSNDTFFVGGERKKSLVSKSEFRRNLRGIIRVCRENGAQVIVSTIPVIDEKSFIQNNDISIKQNNNLNIAGYNRIVREECLAAGTALADLEAILKKKADTGLFEPDGVHLNRDGQLLAAELWLETVLKIINKEE